MPRRAADSLVFDSLHLEGALFLPAILEKVARGELPDQTTPAAYLLPAGLSLLDEQGRSFRIASALWRTFQPVRVRADVDVARATTGFALDLLRDALGYADIAACLEPIPVGDRAFPVTALAGQGRLAVVVAPHSLDLDTPHERFAIAGSGARRRSAYQLAQQFLNAHPGCTWALVTNGRSLRLVRDSDSLTRPAFLEADLNLILASARYADFAAVWRVFHASRLGASDVSCSWENWRSLGQDQGERVREGLRAGVTDALLVLGTGFIEHPANEALRLRLQSGDLAVNDYLQQLFRLIYRFLFLFTVEERGLLHVPDDSPEARRAREAYAQGYAFRRLRDRALRRSGFDRYSDIWTSVRIVFSGLADGQPRLALPALGGLFATTQCPDIDGASLENRTLLTAMRHLRWSAASGQLAAIDYRNMDSEELGSVYESLLELVPTVDLPARRFGFVGLTDAGSTAGNARKTSGSYYTPDSLVQELIKSALDPVIAQKIADHPANPVEALLTLSVCDPSCGSGHFLLAAARRIAEKLAELRAVDGAVTPDDYRHALREVASRCLYGVDINPMAVELCRVALWLETIDPGKPLGFLDHHIRTGNSLLGTTPDLIAAGIPDGAFTAIEGDDKAACSELKKQNKKEREGFGPLFQQEEQSIRDRLRQAATAIEEMDDSQAHLRQQKEAAFATHETAADTRRAKLLADIWCSAFVIKKYYPTGSAEFHISNSPSQIAPVEDQLLHTQDELFGQPAVGPAAQAPAKKQSKTKSQEQGTPIGITTAHIRDFVQGRPLPADLLIEVEALVHKYRFFHWHLAFPQVFDQGGFDCILGNPPWERVNVEARQFFASRRPDIAEAITTKRRNLIAELEASAPELFKEFADAQRGAAAEISFFQNSGRYPHLNQARLNTYVLFTEITSSVCAEHGRVGIIVPSGVATDEISRSLFAFLMEEQRIASLFDFENREGLFPAIDSRMKFCLLTLTGGKSNKSASFSFFLHAPEQLSDQSRIWNLSAQDIELLSPISGLCPTFRNSSDRELVLRMLKRVLPFITQQNTNTDWTKSDYLIMFRSDDSTHLYRSLQQLGISEPFTQNLPLLEADGIEYVPVWESKLLHQFDHRFATFASVPTAERAKGNTIDVPPENKADHWIAVPRYWAPRKSVVESFATRSWSKKWSTGYRDITNATNERTAIASVLPEGGAAQPLNLFLPETANHAILWVAGMNSFSVDYIVRQRIGGVHLNITTCRQLPLIAPSALSTDQIKFIQERALELIYTTPALAGFAADCGWHGSPFRWNEERRFLLRCELDAAFFHVYLGPQSEWQQQPAALTRAFPTPRHAVAYIMDTFPIVKRKDEAKHGGVYRTKETILQIYDALQESIRTGQPYQTRLDPPPADPRCCHPPRDVAFVVPTSSPIQAVSLPQAPRVPYKSEDIPHYLNFLVYAWAKKGEDRANLRTVIRAFTLLQFPQRISSRLHNEEPGAKDWLKSFREPIKGHTLRPVLEALIDRKALSLVRHPSGEIILELSDAALAVKIPGAILQDADFSLRAAGIELSKEPPLSPTETTEFEHLASLVSSF